MAPFLHFCQIYSGAIQAIATVVLIVITSYYAVVTHRSLRIASHQLEASLLPQISMEFMGPRFSSQTETGRAYSVAMQIYNSGAHPFTLGKAEARFYFEAAPTRCVGVKELGGLKDRVVAGQTPTKEVVRFVSADLTGDTGEVVGDWKLEILLHVYNALHTQGYKYLYDEQHGIRRLAKK